MAKKAVQKPKEKPKKSGRRLALPALLLAFALAAGFTGWMYAQAKITHLKPAEVYLADLPGRLDGTKLLFISDLNLSNAAEAHSAAKLLNKLQALNADMLLLGGDIMEDKNAPQEYLSGFAGALAAFPAPMGKFAVNGETDGNLESMYAYAGVQQLRDACANVDGLIIAGLSDVSQNATPYTELGRYFNGDECVIALAHNPSAYIGIRVAEARGGGAWADLVLSGHTNGGKIKLLGRTLREYPEEEARTLSGWHYADDLPLLVNQGVNTKGLPLRLGTESEVWLLTLRAPMQLPDLR